MFQEKANKEIDDSDELYNALMKHVQDSHAKLKQNIQEKLRKSEDKDKEVIKELQEEITQLQMMHSKLEELSQSEDHLQLLQVSQYSPYFPSLCAFELCSLLVT